MFKLTYRPKENRNKSLTEWIDNIEYLGQRVLQVTDSEKESESAMKWCSNAKLGDKITRQPNYKIECVKLECSSEDTMKKMFKAVARQICEPYKIEMSEPFWDNDSLTIDIGLGLSWMKYNYESGYYLVINKEETDGTCTELASLVAKGPTRFVTDARKIIETFKNGSTDNSKAIQFANGRIYRCEVTVQRVNGKYKENKSIIILKRTPKYIEFQLDTGFKSRALIRTENNSCEVLNVHRREKFTEYSIYARATDMVNSLLEET